jgi:hypothetical protein
VVVNPETDTTVDFSTRTLSNQEQPSRRAQRRAGILNEMIIEKKVDTRANTRANTSETEATYFKKELLKRTWGLNGVSFDSIPNCDVNDNLFAVSKGLIKPEDLSIKILTRKWRNLNSKSSNTFESRLEIITDWIGSE